MVEHFVYTEGVDGSSPSLPKMNNLILNAYFLIFLFYTLFFFFLFNLIQNLNQTKYKYSLIGFGYLCFVIFFLFSYILKENKNFFITIIWKYNIQTVLKDPQQILEVLFNFSIWIVLIYTLLSSFFFLYIIFINILRKIEINYVNTILFLFFYYFIIFYIISSYDFLTFHIEIFSQQKILQYQPDIEKWYFYTELEIIDWLIFLLSLNIIFLWNLYINIFFKIIKIKIIRIYIYLYFYIFLIMFIGGDTILHDFIITLLILFCSEIYIFSHVFFYKIKQLY